jgi:hypothetical protein
MAPIFPTLPSLAIPSIHKRNYECTYYDATCSTHRLVVMIIIIVVGILVSAILSLLYVRSRRSKAAKSRVYNHHQHIKMHDALVSQTLDRPQRRRQQHVKMHDAWANQTLDRPQRRRQERHEGFGGMYGAPPPYTPRRPERAFGVGGESFR